MSALIAAAKKEGQLNVITLPSNWANYGTIMKDFTAKYGIKITDANPDGSSQDELNAIAQLKGQSRAPDVVDVGTAFAVKGDQAGDWAPYEVATWSDIPADAKAPNGDWYADYGGYVAIGYNSATVKTPPTSFADLLKPVYKNQVAINGNPTQASAAFSAVFASALANGGSLDNIAPGIAYFKKLHSVGNFVPVTASAATMESGQTPIVIWWDYLLASEIGPSVPSLKIVIPSDGVLRRLLRPGHQQVRAGPGRGPALGGIPVLHHRPEPLAAGEARPIELPTLISRRHGRPDSPQGAAARPRPAASPSRPRRSRRRRRTSSRSNGPA